MNNQSSISKRTRRLCLAAVFMAFNILPQLHNINKHMLVKLFSIFLKK